MKAFVLHGPLGEKYGEMWNLDVRSPAEGLRAIEANCPGFAQDILAAGRRGVGYRIVADTRDVSAEDIAAPFGNEVIHLVPEIEGAGGGGFGKIILGAIIIAAAIYTFNPTLAMGSGLFGGSMLGTMAGNFGISLVLGGVSQMLSSPPEAPSSFSDSPAQLDSKYFSGPVNNVAQGNAIPIGYGEAYIGSQVISAGISTQAG